MGLNVRFEWTYEPSSFFEEEFASELEGAKFKIDEGKIVAEIDKDRYEADSGLREKLLNHVKGLFEGVRLQSHEDFEIHSGSIHEDRPDGGTNITITAGPASVVAMTGEVDVKVTDAEGNVVHDSKQERIQEKREFAEMVASSRGTDETLDKMLESYSNAVKDPDDELVHLFEIREFLASRFCSDKSARKAIGISSNKWSALGRLANDEPLNQGRHRGRKLGELRDASNEELGEARQIAREMIVRYINALL